MTDEKIFNALERVYDKMDANQAEIKDLIEKSDRRTMSYVRERFAMIDANLDRYHNDIKSIELKQGKQAEQIALNKQLAESTAKDVGARAGSIRGAVVSLIIGIIMLILSISLKGG